jgi:hypothetical protein
MTFTSSSKYRVLVSCIARPSYRDLMTVATALLPPYRLFLALSLQLPPAFFPYSPFFLAFRLMVRLNRPPLMFSPYS